MILTPSQTLDIFHRRVSTRYYDPSGREIARPIRGLTIIREQHADGTINIRKISTE